MEPLFSPKRWNWFGSCEGRKEMLLNWLNLAGICYAYVMTEIIANSKEGGEGLVCVAPAGDAEASDYWHGGQVSDT